MEVYQTSPDPEDWAFAPLPSLQDPPGVWVTGSVSLRTWGVRYEFILAASISTAVAVTVTVVMVVSHSTNLNPIVAHHERLSQLRR